ncbi:MAG: N-6 DNA methylase [Solirubrobacterales bacterium]
MTSTARITRLLRAAERGETDAVVRFFERAGWGAAVREVHATVGQARLVELSWADEPQALIVLADGDSDTSVSSWGYSREAPYALAWHPERLSLFDSRYWSETPGDAPLLEAEPSHRWSVRELLEFLQPEALLEDVPGAYGAPDKRQRELHETLAGALGELRIQVAQAGLLEDIDPTERDAEVLRLFHQLLFIRFQEDRGQAASSILLRDLLGTSDIRPPIETALRDYRTHLNSELFQPARIEIADLPSAPLVEVISQLVEPWARLKLNFSLSRSEIAGRLYQSYLSSLPARKSPGLQGTFFAEAQVIDEQAAHASYYTPPGLARLVVERTLVPWLKSKQPDAPSEVRILDPACGSGAFLIAGYRALIDYFSERKGAALSASERTDLLLESVFGADIDERALELARVQLLEEADVRGRLPVLGENLLHGDSLLCPPGSPQSPGAVDWDTASRGGRGFDAVLTNPPFLTRYKLGSKFSAADLEGLAELYPEVSGAHTDYSYFFVELALRLLSETGVAGFVLPAGVVRAGSAAPVRARLADRGLRSVVDFDAGRLFDASTYVCTVSTGPGRSTELLRATDLSRDGRVLLEAAERPDSEFMRRQRVPRRLIAEESTAGWDAFRLRWELELRSEIEVDLAPLAAAGRTIRYGTKPGRQSDFTVKPDEWRRAGAGKFAVGDHRIPERYLPRLVKGGQISPFHYTDTGDRVFVPYETDGTLATDPDVLGELERRGGLPRHPQHGDLGVLRGPKLLLRTLAPEISTIADLQGDLMPLMAEAGAIAVRIEEADSVALMGYEALLNSAFYQWWLGGMAQPRQGGWFALNVSLVESIPVPSLAAGALEVLASLAGAAREALAQEVPLRRLEEFHRARGLVDVAVFDLLGVSERLRSLVEEEVRRVV